MLPDTPPARKRSSIHSFGSPSSSGRKTLAEKNFLRAAARLEKKLYSTKASRDGRALIEFQIPVFHSPRIEAMSGELEMALEKIIQQRHIARTQRIDKVESIMQSWLRACYPFVKILISTAKAGSQLTGTPFGIICDALLWLATSAYTESRRGDDLDDALNVLWASVHSIQLTAEFPRSVSHAQAHNIQCIALDLCAAIMDYLAVALKTFQRPLLSTSPQVVPDLDRLIIAFALDTELQEAKAKLNASVSLYTAAIVDLSSHIGIQLLNRTTAIEKSMAEISNQFETLIESFEKSAVPSPARSHATTPEPPSTPSPIFMVPYERNPLFTGRQIILEMLRQSLLETAPKRYNHRIAVHGLGGIGKTQIALEYCYRHRQEYGHIFWLHAADRSTLVSGYMNIGRETNCIPARDDRSLDHLATDVLKWLNSTDQWLLVLDNVDDVSVVRDLLPAYDTGGHVLITTRIGDVRRIPAEGLEILPMEELEGIEFLMAVSNIDSEGSNLDEARMIVEVLGGLPLAIDQAAAFIRSSDTYAFLDILSNNASELLSETPLGNHPYPRSISCTSSISLGQLSPAAKSLAELFAFLNPDEILVDFLEAGACELKGSAGPIIRKRYSFLKALSDLQSLSLVKVWDKGQKISMHRLVQSVIRDSLSPVNRLDTEDEILQISANAFPYSLTRLGAESLMVCRKFLPQITGGVLNFQGSAYDQFALSPLSDSVAAFLFDDGHFSECQKLDERLVEVRTRILGPNDPRTLCVMRGLAMIYSSPQNDTATRAKGFKLFHDTLDRQTTHLGPSHPDTLWTKHGIGVMLYLRDQLDEAAKILQETFQARSRILGVDNLHTLRTQFFLSQVYWRQGLLLDALNLMEGTLVVQFQSLGETHADTLRTMHLLAKLNAELGHINQARTLYERTLKLTELVGEGQWSTRHIKTEMKMLDKWTKTREDKDH